MRALDLFCGAGGASMGLHRAGFEVIGVDLRPQPRYPFVFVQADALRTPFDLAAFDLIWASPPCQAYTQMSVKHRGKGGKADSHHDLIAPIRSILQAAGVPYVIENVVGARHKMKDVILLRGSHFGLGVDRARLFESSLFIMTPDASQRAGGIVGVYGKVPDGRRLWNGYRAARGLNEAQHAMTIDWMEWRELAEAIPPAYSEFIGRAVLAQLQKSCR